MQKSTTSNFPNSALPTTNPNNTTTNQYNLDDGYIYKFRSYSTDDYQQLRDAALSEKKNKVVEGWFDEVKDQVYVRVSEDFKACKILEN